MRAASSKRATPRSRHAFMRVASVSRLRRGDRRSGARVEELLPRFPFLEPAQAEPDEDPEHDEASLEQHDAAAEPLIRERRESPRPRCADVRLVERVARPQEDGRESEREEPHAGEIERTRANAEPARARQEAEERRPNERTARE